MSLIYQIPRNSLAWLLFAQLAVIAPHSSRLPLWILGAWLLVVIWRIQVFRGIWSFPGPLVKTVLVGVCGISIIFGYGRLFGLEPMVALLVSAFTLKLLEMYRKRDVLVVIFLGFFILSTHFLFTSNLSWGLYGLICVVLLTTSLMGLNQSLGYRYPVRSLKLTVKLVLQCVPLMILLFLVMPRIGALWKVPYQQTTSRTGVSDSMSPGDFSRLARSGGLAFRVSFDGGVIPPSQELYWRGLVFSDFNGRRWTQADPSEFQDGPAVIWNNSQSWSPWVKTRGLSLNYSITLEPTQQPWLYALAVPRPVSSRIGFTRDFRLINRKPVRNRFHYRVKSYPRHTTEAGALPDWRLQRELQLPSGFNPESIDIAKNWYREAGNTQAYIQRVLQYFNEEFTYTLEPPLLGLHSVDEFLWQTKRGFCEHYSSSFVFMMRAAGIPARVVVGYQGGEINPLNNYLLVHQYDAHAWAEVHLGAQGWVRVDPTAAVAPERVERSLQDALSQQESLLVSGVLSLNRYRHIELLNTLRLRWDALNYNWHRWVLNYDSQTQLDVLTRLLGKVDPLRMSLFIIGTGTGILLLIALGTFWLRRRPGLTPATSLYLRFVRKLERIGFVRLPGETPGAFAKRVSTTRPDLKEHVRSVTDLYEEIVYKSHHKKLADLKQEVSRFKATATT